MTIEYASSPVEHAGTHTRITKEARDVDQQVAIERRELVGTGLQEAQVVVELVDLLHGHAALDPALDGVLLVTAQVVPERVADEDVEPVHACRFRARARPQVRMVADRRELLGQLFGREREVGDARVDRAARHAVELCGLRQLNEADAAVLLDRLETEGPVGAHAREHDTDGVRAQLLGERAKEEVDRQARVRLHEVERPPEERDVRARRGQVDVVRLDDHPVFDLEHLHARRPPEELHEQALVLGRAVLHDHERHGVELDRVEQRGERFQATRRGADAYDREGSEAVAGRARGSSCRVNHHVAQPFAPSPTGGHTPGAPSSPGYLRSGSPEEVRHHGRGAGQGARIASRP
jgi:hypothetical protein